MQPSFEIFDHTADAGIRVQAATLPELIGPATQGLYALIGELVATGDEEAGRFERSGSDAAELLRDYLAEVLLLFDCRHRVISAQSVLAFEPRHLEVAFRTRGVDDEKSVYFREVKAITYHELSIRPVDGGFEAAVIVDI